MRGRNSCKKRGIAIPMRREGPQSLSFVVQREEIDYTKIYHIVASQKTEYGSCERVNLAAKILREINQPERVSG